MFYCPNCNNTFDIRKSDSSIKTKKNQHGGKNNYDDIINKLINNKIISIDDIKTIDIKDLFKNDSFKKLNSKQQEFIYNKIQDILPEKKILKQKQINYLQNNIAFFVCMNCGFTKTIEPKTLIFSRTSDEISQSYISTDYKNMLNSNILPRTRRYICPNEKCISHTELEKREAIFFRINNTYKIKYICTSCGTDF